VCFSGEAGRVGRRGELKVAQVGGKAKAACVPPGKASFGNLATVQKFENTLNQQVRHIRHRLLQRSREQFSTSKDSPSIGEPER